MATVRLQLRRGLAEDWFDANPTLAPGEIGIETDTNTFKFGDGDTPWRDLDYALSGTVDDYIALSTKGVANGVASLDGAGLIPVAQLPGAAALDAEVATAVTNHNNVTTNVHGIANTSLLATTANVATAKSEATSTAASDATSKANAAQAAAEATASADATSKANAAQAAAISAAATDATTKANAAQAAAEATAATASGTALSTHEADTTSVHGIADTSILVTTTGSQTLTSKSLTSPALTGTPTAPTASAGTDTTQVATTAFVQDAIELVVGAAPAALNTLAEIATSLADNADLSGTLTTAISGKVAKSGDTMSGELNMGTNKISNLGVPTTGTDASTKAYSDGAVINALTNHSSISTNIHGILDAANLVYTSDVRLSDLRVPQDNSVATEKIVDLNVTTAKIGDSAVTAAKIADGAVGTSEVADSAVTSAKIADSAVTAAKIADGAVGTAEVADSAVTSAKIADSAIVAAKIGTGAVETAALADLAVTTGKIADSAVTSAKIATNAISQSHLSDDSVGTNEIGGLAVTTGKLADSAVTTGKINNSAVTEDKIAGLAVTEGKIADGAVSTVKIADSAITTGKLANDSVTTGKIAADTIVNADINPSAAIAQSKIDGLGAALDLKAPLDSPTFTGTVSGVTKSHVGLGNVDNTADTAKPVSTAQATAIATAKSEAIADATSQVNALLTGAPAALNTLDELAAALGDDANFASTVTTNLAGKAPLASPTFTGTVTVGASGVAFTDKTQTKAGVPSLTTIGTAVSSNTTLDLLGTDAAVRDSLVPLSGAVNVSFEATGNAKYAVGSSISFYQSSGTGANITGNGITVLSTPGGTLRALNSSVTATKIAATTWLLAGDLR